MLNFLKKILKTEHISVDVLLIYVLKTIYHSQLFNLASKKESKILFIVGCQRSGTSLMNRVFTKDLNISVYRERSQLSSKDPKRIRLNLYKEVDKEFQKNKASYIIVKPLVETQNILQLLEYFSNSKALWMYRNYKDFVQSHMRRFHTNVGIDSLKAIVEREPGNWRSESVSEYVYTLVDKYYKEDMNPHDASALFWLSRNQLFFDLSLDTNPHIFMCRYEDLVQYPERMVQEIYKFMGAKLPNRKNLLREINTFSLGKGSTIMLSPDIEEICQSLLKRMNSVYFVKHPVFNTK
jgi:hypothetical protein